MKNYNEFDVQYFRKLHESHFDSLERHKIINASTISWIKIAKKSSSN